MLSHGVHNAVAEKGQELAKSGKERRASEGAYYVGLFLGFGLTCAGGE